MKSIPYILILSMILSCLAAACMGKSKTVTAIAINPKRPDFVYITTNDRVYKTKDGGETWTVITQGMGAARILSLAVHPELTSTLYAGTMGDSVYRSMDGGQRWSIINAGMKEHVSVVNSFAFHPEDRNIFFAGTTVGVFKTENGGLMWEEMPNKGMDSVYVVTIIVDKDDPEVLFIGTSGGVYRTSDGGATWQLQGKGMIHSVIETGLELGVNWLVQDPVNTDTIYAATTNGAYKSEDHGASWTKMAGGLSNGFIPQILIDYKNPSVLYAGSTEGIYKSSDHGRTWTRSDEDLPSKNIRIMAMNPKNPEVLYTGTQRGLFKTVDGGLHWRELDFLSKPEPEIPRT
jgi:photosystem II stability/assembly factor-like uncharacterized protein